MHEKLTQLAEQSRRVELLLDAAPDAECPPDLDDFVSEVEKLITCVASVVAPATKPPAPAVAFEDAYSEPEVDQKVINLRKPKPKPELRTASVPAFLGASVPAFTEK